MYAQADEANRYHSMFITINRYETPIRLTIMNMFKSVHFQNQKCDCIKSLKLGEPCIGSGAFYSALLSTVNNDCCVQTATGIEIDKSYYDCAAKLWNDSGIELIQGDFCTH